MEKYLGDEGNRLYFAYEDFIHPQKGPQEARRLAQFLDEGIKASTLEWVMSAMEKEDDSEEQPIDVYLEKGLSPEEAIDKALREATKTMVKIEDVPCIWKEVVYSTIASSSQEETTTRQRRILQADAEEESIHFSSEGGD